MDLDPGLDSDKAQELIMKLKNERKLPNTPIRFIYMEGRDDESIALELTETWASYGLNIEAIGMPWTDLYQTALDGGDYDLIMLGGWTADYPPHPMTFLETFKTGSFYSQFTRWSSDEYDKKIKALQLLTDESESLSLMRELESMIIDDHHIIPIYHRRGGLYIVSPNLKGWFRNSSSQFDFSNAW